MPAFMALAFLALCSLRSHAQAALLMEEPYGLFGALNPTGHLAIYFERVCADTPMRLRRCTAGEAGSVIARYHASPDTIGWPSRSSPISIRSKALRKSRNASIAGW
jgi:hypothetical protein